MAYNPGVEDRSGELLGRGIERGFGGLVEGFMRKQERDKNLLQTAKHVEGIVKLNPKLLEELGMSPEEFNMKGAEEKIGLGMGAVSGALHKMQTREVALREEQMNREEARFKEQLRLRERDLENDHSRFQQQFGLRERELQQGMERFNRQFGLQEREADSQQKYYGLRQRAMEAEIGQDEALGRALQQYAGEPAENGGRLSATSRRALGFQESSPDARMQRALRTPGLGGRGAVNLMETLARMQPKEKAISARLLETQLPGVYINPNSGSTVGSEAKEFTADDFVAHPSIPGMVFNKKSGALQSAPKQESDPAAQPWELSENNDEFLQGVQTLANKPEELKKVLDRRVLFNRSMGKTSLQEELMLWTMSGGDVKDFFKSKAGKGGGGSGAAAPKVRKWSPDKGLE